MQKPETTENLRIAVVGAGSWGTALAGLLASKGYGVDLWVFEQKVREEIEKSRENKTFLPGFFLPETLVPNNDLEEVVREKDLVLIVVPSHVMRETARKMAGFLTKECIVVSASKGIENQTLMTMSEVILESVPGLSPDKLCVLSGPSFAKEVANHDPTVVTVACKDRAVGEIVQKIFATPYFRVYVNDDITGVELGGSVKNVIAIAAGIIDGLGLGLNTRAALITRGLAEIQRLGKKMGADPRTLSGAAGVGDLVLTCTGSLSRNYTVGYKIGEGKKLSHILDEMKMVAEGVKTSRSLFNLCKKLDVEMPISEEVYKVLYEDVPPTEALFRLMTRDLKHELDDYR